MNLAVLLVPTTSSTSWWCVTVSRHWLLLTILVQCLQWYNCYSYRRSWIITTIWPPPLGNTLPFTRLRRETTVPCSTHVDDNTLDILCYLPGPALRYYHYCYSLSFLWGWHWVGFLSIECFTRREQCGQHLWGFSISNSTWLGFSLDLYLQVQVYTIV